MPWFPDFVSAVELARQATHAAGVADPAAQFVKALDRGETRDLETAWPGEVVVNDPRGGEIRSHRQLRQFINANHSWFAAHHTRVEKVASTGAGRRAVLELLAHVTGDDGGEIAWPVAVVAECPDELSVAFRTYCSQWPVERRRPVRPPILRSIDLQLDGVVARYAAALGAGDADAVVATFVSDGYYREPIGVHAVHRGTAELRTFFAAQLNEGGIGLQHCPV